MNDHEQLDDDLRPEYDETVLKQALLEAKKHDADELDGQKKATERCSGNLENLQLSRPVPEILRRGEALHRQKH